MKKFITAIISVLMLCIPFASSYAYDMLYEDFHSETIDAQKWTADFRSGPTSGITVLEDGNKVMQVNGTFSPRSQENIDAGKDYRHAMLRASSIDPGTTNPLKISFDIKINDLGEGSAFKLNFTSGSRNYTMLDFLDTGDIKVGYRGRQDGGECFTMGKWYTVSVEHKPTAAKPFTITITPHDTTESVITRSYDLDRIFNSSVKSQVVASGINIIDFMASGVGAADDESKVEVYYDNIRIEKAPIIKTVEITGDAIVGKKLNAVYTADATEPDFDFEWYAENGDEDILLSEEEEYIIQKEDAEKEIYVKVITSDRSGYSSAPLSSNVTETVKAFTLSNNESLTSQNIVFGYGVDIQTFDGAVSLVPAGGGETIFPTMFTASEDGKTVQMTFAEGALSYDTEYTVIISSDAKYIAEENAEIVSCSGNDVFTSRIAPGIVLSSESCSKKEGIMLLGTIKLFSNVDNYEQINVYAQLIRNGNIIKTHSFLIDADISTDYILKAGFISDNSLDTIKWFCEKDGAEMSNVLSQRLGDVE